MKKKNTVIFSSMISAAAAAVFIAGCGGSSNSESSSSTTASTTTTAAATTQSATTTASSTASAGKHANVGIFYLTPSIDPAADYSGWATTRLGVGECLVKLDQELKIEAVLADSWENIDDNTWEFHIRDGVKFSNGKPCDAAAVKASLERTIGMNVRAEKYLMAESIEADGQKLTIKTSEPNAALLNNLVEPVFDIIDVNYSDDEIASSPIGTGPYIVDSMVSEQSVSLVKNPDYWDGTPGLDTIDVILISDNNSRAMALQSGEIDVAHNMDYNSVAIFEGDDNFIIDSRIGMRLGSANMNNAESSPLHDIELRKALSWGIDRKSYAEAIGCTEAHGVYSDALPFGNENLNGYSHDPDKAIEILDAAGYSDADGDGLREAPDGSELNIQIYMNENNENQTIAVGMQQDLKSIGINSTINVVENLSDVRKSGDFDIYVNGSGPITAPTGDPQAWLETNYTDTRYSESSGNDIGFSDERINDILDRLNKTFDIEERYKIAQEASQVLLDDAANLYIKNQQYNVVYSKKLKGVENPVCDYYYITKDFTLAE